MQKSDHLQYKIFITRYQQLDFNSATQIRDLSLTSVQQHHTVIRPATRLRHRFDLFPMIKPLKIFLLRNSIIIRSNYLIIHVHGHSESKDILRSTLRRSHRSHVLRPRFSNYNDTLRSVQRTSNGPLSFKACQTLPCSWK